MIEHIVIWRVKDRGNEQTRAQTTRAIKARLEGLRGRIPGLLHIEAGGDFSRSETAYDVALYSESANTFQEMTWQKKPPPASRTPHS